MFFHRTLLGPLASGVSRAKVRLLFGARQTGKTQLLRHLLEGSETAVFDLQDSGLRRRFEEDPARFGREVRALPKEKRVVLVDEVQKVPALLDEVQHLHDSDPRGREFFLTGSSARRLRRGAANLLPGRSHVYTLAPVTRWEQGIAGADPLLAEPESAPPPRALAAPPFPAQDLERALLFGSLPGVMQEPPATAAATLSGYVETYLEEELRREAIVRDLGGFSTFLRLAALESGRVVNLAKLSRDSGIPQSTLKNFYQVLLDTFAGHRVEAYGRRGRKRVLSTPRFLLFDGGVRNAAAGLPFDPAVLESSGGELLEHWVGLELLHRVGYRGRGWSVSSWRTPAGAEVDFVLEAPGEDLPIEVKWTRRPSPADARHLESFLDTYPRRAKRGLIVCRAEAREQLSERVTSVPWREL
jgi:predicted AAA+ superfamily ATPase